VLTDLGVGRVLGDTAAAEVTPAYVDPTVARGGAAGPASDVFGVAAAAFHALTGIAPWNAATPGDTLQVAADGLLPDLAELASGAPADLLAVIARGLAADPHDRGSAAAFALDLRHSCRPEPVRLPRDDVPDDELGRTGRAPRTELTHQVPGRRPRPGPVTPAPPRHRELRRDAVRGRSGRRAAVGGLVVAVAVAGWLLLRPSAGPAPAGPSAAVPSVAAPTVVPRAQEAADPSTVEQWRAVVGELYRRRAEAFATAAPALLADVYAEGSPLLSADAALATALAEAGEALRGFAPTVEQVTAAEPDGDRVRLDLVDAWAPYEVVSAARPDGASVRDGPGRPATAVRMVLVRHGGRWLIESAARAA